MKQLTLILSLMASIVFTGCGRHHEDAGQTINPLLGDASFTSKYGDIPAQEANEDLRIKTHLEYVEKLLRQKDASHLPANIREKRTHLLDLLHEYHTAGVFPRNYDHPDKRVPCFIDRDGRICAVGYLVEQTAGRQVAEDINSRHKYDELLAMNDPTVDGWLKGSGLTEEEAAMIQPSYGPSPTYTSNNISPAYGISSSFMTGVNVSVAAINGVQILKGTGGKVMPVVGIFTGAGQMILGAAMFSSPDNNTTTGNHNNESHKTLSMVNIGLGTATVIMSAWNLIGNRPARDTRTGWNVYSFPTPGNKAGLALSFTRRI